MRRCSDLLPRRPFVPQMIQVYFLEGSAVGLSIVGLLSAASIVVLELLGWRFKPGKSCGLFAVKPEGLCFSSSSMSDTFQDLEV